MSDPNQTPEAEAIPDPYLAQSMLVALFCLCGAPLAVPGLVMGFRCAGALERGEAEAARFYADRARFWTRLGFWAGAAAWLIGLGLGVAAWIFRT